MKPAAWMVALSFLGWLAACGPSHPPGLTVAPLIGCTDEPFDPPAARIVLHGPVADTKECAWLVLAGDSRLAPPRNVALTTDGWGVQEATLLPGDCTDTSGDPRPVDIVGGQRIVISSAEVDGSVSPNGRHIDIDVELSRGPLSRPKSVFMDGQLDAQDEAVCPTP